MYHPIRRSKTRDRLFPVSLPTRAGLERVLLVMYYESLGVARLLARGAHGETGRVIVHYEQLLMEKYDGGIRYANEDGQGDETLLQCMRCVWNGDRKH